MSTRIERMTCDNCGRLFLRHVWALEERSVGGYYSPPETYFVAPPLRRLWFKVSDFLHTGRWPDYSSMKVSAP